MHRRKYLAALGLATGTTLAGCSGTVGNNNSNNSSGNGGNNDTGGGGNSGATAGGGGATGKATSTEDGGATTTGNAGSDTEAEAATGATTETPANTTAASSGGGFSKTFTGNGTSTVEGLTLSPGPVTAEFSVNSEGYYNVTLVTLEGKSYQDVYLIDGIMSGEGSQVKTVSVGGGYNLNVDIDGDWKLTIEQPTNPQPKSLPIEASGNGMDYLGPFEFGGPTTFQGSHSGEANFIVDAIPVDPSAMRTIVFNKLGQFDGEITRRINGTAYLNIVADDEWTLSTG